MTKLLHLPLLICLMLGVLPLPALGAGMPPAPPVAGSVASPGGEARLDLNLATREQLLALPGIGPATADAILARRESAGAFSDVDALLEVKGIGAKRLAELRDLVFVSPRQQAAAPAP